MAYVPNTPFTVPMKLLIPTWKTVSGVRKKVYPSPDEVTDDDMLIFGSFRTFGGTETNSNGVYSIENTATIETWFRPDITADCQIALIPTGEIYEVIGAPENIEMRNQYLKFKVKMVGGKA